MYMTSLLIYRFLSLHRKLLNGETSSFSLFTDVDDGNPVETEGVKKPSMKVLMTQKGTRDHTNIVQFGDGGDGEYIQVANTLVDDFSDLEKIMTNVKSEKWAEGSIKKLVSIVGSLNCCVDIN